MAFEADISAEMYKSLKPTASAAFRLCRTEKRDLIPPSRSLCTRLGHPDSSGPCHSLPSKICDCARLSERLRDFANFGSLRRGSAVFFLPQTRQAGMEEG